MDRFWKEVSEGLNAQVKELAEKRAVNTAKKLNEIHEATRKEMKNETLIERLKVVGKHYNTHHDLFLLCREATAEIERLQTELDFTIKALYASPYNLALAAHSDKRFSGYETIHINKDEVIRNDDLTMRDHIAIAAMEGILARQSFGLEDFVAERAYEQADAMLKAREKKNA